MKRTVAAALARAREARLARLDAQLLLAHTLDRGRAWLIANDDATLTPTHWHAFEAAARRRAAGEPLAYITGSREFRGLMLRVTPAVLVPRPETEGLVDWALERLAASGVAAAEVVDLGTGSGAIALAIAAAHPSARVVATDVSAAALAVAGDNARRLGLPLMPREGAWWSAVPQHRFNLAVCNPPYIAGNDAHLAALAHEPRLALTPEGDGLAALHEVIDGATARLYPDGWLLLEHGHDQAAAVSLRLAQQGFVDIETRTDLAGLDRCSGGRWPGRRG